MQESGGAAAEHDEVALVGVEVGGQLIYLAARQTGPVGRDRPSHGAVTGGEEEIAAFRGGKPKLEQLLDGVAVFAQEITGRLQTTNASRMTVQFGCEAAVESGQIVAVIGRASAKSTITIGLEWAKPAP